MNIKDQKFWGSIIALAIILGGIVYFADQNRNYDAADNGDKNDSQSLSGDEASSAEIQYKVDQEDAGKTALELLKAKYTVETKEFAGLGEFVTAINGVAADDKHFWAFYINQEMAQVGASQYAAKYGDQIVWKLEEIR